jgi:hypothetical protein
MFTLSSISTDKVVCEEVLPEVTWPKVTLITWPEGCFAHAQPVPALFSYYCSSTKCSKVVQVAWPPDVTEGRVTPKEESFREVCACATRSCTISALLGHFHRKWRHQTSRDPKGFPWKGGVGTGSRDFFLLESLLTGNDVIKHHP